MRFIYYMRNHSRLLYFYSHFTSLQHVKRLLIPSEISISVIFWKYSKTWLLLNHFLQVSMLYFATYSFVTMTSFRVGRPHYHQPNLILYQLGLWLSHFNMFTLNLNRPGVWIILCLIIQLIVVKYPSIDWRTLGLTLALILRLRKFLSPKINFKFRIFYAFSK